MIIEGGKTRMLRSLFTFFLCMIFLGGCVCAYGQKPIDLSGKWNSGEGEVLVTQNGSNVRAQLLSASDCPFGSSRSYYFQGELKGNTLHGTIALCTHSKQLHDDCNLNDPYTAKFEAKVAPDSIRGTYRPDYINYDTRDGHYVNCRITAGGGSDRSFDLTRSDCCDQVQRLQEQVKALQDRLDRLEKMLMGSDITIGSATSSIRLGSNGISINSDGDITIKSTKNVVIKGVKVTQN